MLHAWSLRVDLQSVSLTHRWSMLTWLLLCERPNCWMALSALQGSSSVRCTRRRWFATLGVAMAVGATRV